MILQYSITAWKDIWFAGFILLLCLKLGDIGINRGQNFKHRNFAIAFFVIVFGCMVFRNNGLAVALIVLFTLFVLLKRYRRVILKGTIAVLLGFIVYTGPLFSFLGVEKSSFAETVGIPIQQLAKTVVDNGTISEENEKFLKQLFDFDEIKQKYDPNIVDPVKWADSFNDSFLESNKLRFMQVWAETFPANVKSYLVAWCDITLGYWYIGANDWIVLHNGYYESELLINSEEIHITGEASQGKSLIETGGIVNPDFVEDQIDILRDVPIVGLIFNIAFLVWAVLIISYGALIERDYWKILPLTPLLLIWVSMLVAAPTFCEFRYIFAFELAVPVLLTFFVKRISPMKSK